MKTLGVDPNFLGNKIFFQKCGRVTFVAIMCWTFMQKIGKIQVVTEISKDGPMEGWTDKGDYYGPRRVKTRGPKLVSKHSPYG